MNKLGLRTRPALRRGILLFSVTMTGACVPGVNHDVGGDTFGGVAGPPPVFEAPINSTIPPPAITGGTLAVLPDGHTAVAADPDRDRIFVVDYQAGIVRADVTLTAGDEPGRVATDDQGRVHVALRRGGAVITLAPPTWQVAARRQVCAAPRGIAFAPTTQLLHVACAEGELVSLPASPDGVVTRRLPLDGDLRDVVVKGDRLFVSRFRSAEVLVVDGDTMVARLRPATTQSFVTTTTSTPNGSSGGSMLTAMVPDVAWRMVADPQGDVIMLHQRARDGEVSVQEGGYGGSICGGGIVETTLASLGPTRPTLQTPALANVAVAVDVAVSANGDFVVMAVPGNARQGLNGRQQLVVARTTSVIVDNLRGCALPNDPLPVPGATTGADAGNPDGGTMPADAAARGAVLSSDFVASAQGEVVAVAFDAVGNLLVQTREPATVQLVTQQPARTMILSADSRLDTGHAIFHANTGIGVACASCHPEGGDDGRVWQFRAKDGTLMPRRTQNLRGGILATAPFHWDGDLPTVDKLMTEVFVGRMSGPKLGADMVGTLQHWLDTIPAMPFHAVQDPAAVERGRALFNGAPGCSTCHSGGLLTNNQNKDVGTGRALQVPSLRGVSWRAPYMHNGCAPTLRDRFSQVCGGGDKHGTISSLGEGDIADLIAFVQTL